MHYPNASLQTQLNIIKFNYNKLKTVKPKMYSMSWTESDGTRYTKEVGSNSQFTYINQYKIDDIMVSTINGCLI